MQDTKKSDGQKKKIGRSFPQNYGPYKTNLTNRHEKTSNVHCKGTAIKPFFQIKL